MKLKNKTVLKENGERQALDTQKIFRSIWKTAQDVGGKDEKLAHEISSEVITKLAAKYPNGELIETREIGELIEKVLIERGHAKTAKAYILFRENKKHFKQDKDSLGIKDDIGLSYNTLYILKRRFLKRTETGEIIETPAGMLKRVAKFLAGVEETKAKKNKYEKEFFELMRNFDFLPGTRTLVNAGKIHPQLANCFVWPLQDDINHIFEILHKSTLIKKHGGGCGYNFSNIRPEEDVVNGIPELAAGPVKMIQMFDLMTSMFRQEGRYESGNMAILNVDHPDIFNFITAKQTDGYLSKTNISVGITDKFMEACDKNKNWDLINPRTGKVVNTVKAKSILNLMSQMAWASGDPGIINLSAMNKGTALANPLLKKHGPVMTTNPCGEVPLFPFESCNLGYLNFTKFIKDGKFDFDRLEKIMPLAVRMLDNVITASWFPVKEVTEAVKNHRRIGIGAVGWAEALTMLNLPYDSQQALDLAEKVVKTMYQSAFEASVKLAREKGPFPFVADSIWANKKDKPRNIALLTFPPSSSNAVLCETSFGIEPHFALAYEQNILGGVRLRTVIPSFVEALKNHGLYSEDLIQHIIDNHGSIQGISEIPASIRKVYKVAHDIHWRDHIKMQAAFQKWTDNAITKTINMPQTTSPSDIEEAYTLAWKLGCKGLTVYRDKTKKDQVFSFGGTAKTANKLCPNCEIELKRDNKCFKCEQCGFSTCEL